MNGFALFRMSVPPLTKTLPVEVLIPLSCRKPVPSFCRTPVP